MSYLELIPRSHKRLECTRFYSLEIKYLSFIEYLFFSSCICVWSISQSDTSSEYSRVVKKYHSILAKELIQVPESGLRNDVARCSVYYHESCIMVWMCCFFRDEFGWKFVCIVGFLKHRFGEVYENHPRRQYFLTFQLVCSSSLLIMMRMNSQLSQLSRLLGIVFFLVSALTLTSCGLSPSSTEDADATLAS